MLKAHKGEPVILHIPVTQDHRNPVAGGLDQSRVYIITGMDDQTIHLAAEQGLDQVKFPVRVLLAVHEQGDIARIQQRPANGTHHGGAERAGDIRNHHADLHGAVGPQRLGDGIGMIIGHADGRLDPGPGVRAHQVVPTIDVPGNCGPGHAHGLGDIGNRYIFAVFFAHCPSPLSLEENCRKNWPKLPNASRFLCHYSKLPKTKSIDSGLFSCGEKFFVKCAVCVSISN